MSGFYVRSIREHERDECLNLWCSAFTHTGRDYFERYFYGDTEYDPHYTRVGVLDDRLVSCVQIVRRTVTVGESRLTAACIANVSTLPEFTGNGYNRACLQSALEVIAADTFDFSLLGTGIPDYYAKFGWTPVGLPGLLGTLNGLPSQAGTVTRMAVHGDLDAMMAAYNTTFVGAPLAVIRSAGYWRGWLEFKPGAQPDSWLVVETDTGEFLGYVRAERDDDNEAAELEVYELASPQPLDGALCSRLLAAAAAHTGCTPGTKCRVHMPITDAVRLATTTLMHDVRAFSGGGMMFRTVNHDSIFRALLPEITDRWMREGRPQFEVVFETADGPKVSLTTRDNALVLGNVDLETNGIMSQGDLFPLLFGLKAPDELSLPQSADLVVPILAPGRAGTFLTADDF
jgi:predicted N-acetyltransferase YhbS